jgi:glycosyltransferase involved in cell wall biosynthesis
MHDVVVLVPTRHEASNVTALAQRVETTLAATGLSWRLVFVDDSDDETVAVLAGLAAVSCHISVLHRPPAERAGGLAGAVLAGLEVAESRWVAVMDADLQHPPELLAELLQPLRAGTAQVVVGSRFLVDAVAAGRSGRVRPAVSTVARRLVRASLPRARSVTDPLGGFFAFERHVIDDVIINADAVRFLLDLLVRGRWTLVAEIPYTLAARVAGRSKAGPGEGWRLVWQVARLRLLGPAPLPAMPTRAAVAVR